MKYTIILVSVILMLSNAFSQEIKRNRLETSGSTELIVSADYATFSFEVKGVGASLSAAVEQAKNKVRKISKELYKNGIEKKNLSTSYFNSSENYNNKALLSSKRDFKARITVLVTVDSLDLVEQAVLTVSEAKPLKISNIKFGLKKYETLKIDALKKAVCKAKEKATILAQNMGAKLGDVIYIEEIQSNAFQSQYGRKYPNPFNSAVEINRERTIDSGIFSQKIRLSSRVKIIMEIITKPSK